MSKEEAGMAAIRAALEDRLANSESWRHGNWSPRGKRIMSLKLLRSHTETNDRKRFWSLTRAINAEVRN